MRPNSFGLFLAAVTAGCASTGAELNQKRGCVERPAICAKRPEWRQLDLRAKTLDTIDKLLEPLPPPEGAPEVVEAIIDGVLRCRILVEREHVLDYGTGFQVFSDDGAGCRKGGVGGGFVQNPKTGGVSSGGIEAISSESLRVDAPPGELGLIPAQRSTLTHVVGRREDASGALEGESIVIVTKKEDLDTGRTDSTTLILSASGCRQVELDFSGRKKEKEISCSTVRAVLAYLEDQFQLLDVDLEEKYLRDRQ